MNDHMKKFLAHLTKHSEKGQSIVLIALVFVGLLAFIGLTVDMGILFISYGNLRRAVDSAALAAATQMRENYTTTELTTSARQFLSLNNVEDATATVQTCDTNPGDAQLGCTGSNKRKLVRVTASAPVQFAFLPAIGFYGTTITANAIGEAASMDVVLVVDISESMANSDPTGVHPEYLDPHNCNAADPTGTDGTPGSCHPFQEVKSAAANTFTDWILNKTAAEEEDRLAVVVFSNGWQNTYSGNGKIPLQGTGLIRPDGTSTGSPWMNDNAIAKGLINDLKVYENNNALGSQPWMCPAGWQGAADILGSCSEYSNPADPNSTFLGERCPFSADVNPNANMLDGSSCQTTNIGGGLKLAAATLGSARKEALWLVIILTDGAANATEVTHDNSPAIVDATGSIYKTGGVYQLPFNFCPPGTEQHGCRDNSVATRHPSGNAAYDADDYARDMADLVSCDPKTPVNCSRAGQGAVMFGIGLGGTVVGNPVDSGGVSFGDTLLRYIGAVGDDGNPATDPCSGVAKNSGGYDCGNYYFTPNGAGLDNVFTQIASRIYTRLTR
jgi:Flp pilus assembly protein TadG